MTIKSRTLLHGDSLDMLRGIDSETIHLIATDPPFNKGRDFHATPDSVARGASFQDRWSWDKDVHEEWVDKITDDFPKVMNVIQGSRNSYGDDMGAFLCFMGVRLLEMHRVLKPTGSMYLHCDPTASHYLKELMDAVFGKKNFLNEIIWYYRGAGVPKTQYARRHDVLLWYAKHAGRHYFNPDPARQPYAEATVKRFQHYIGNVRGGRDYGQQELNKQGKHPDDVFSDIQPVAPSANERTGYPTQKPTPLLERIIDTSSKKGDFVLDPFCGCATTLVAAEKLGRQWIGIDIWDKAHEVVIKRLKKERYLAGPDGKHDGIIVTEGMITYSKVPPERTDGGSEAVPFLETRMKKFDETERDPYTNARKKEILLERHGSVCQGCGIELHERYLELDHQLPRADGGSNLLRNRILLCGPCNKLKRHLYTISWLRRENKRLGYMVNEGALVSLK